MKVSCFSCSGCLSFLIFLLMLFLGVNYLNPLDVGDIVRWKTGEEGDLRGVDYVGKIIKEDHTNYVIHVTKEWRFFDMPNGHGGFKYVDYNMTVPKNSLNAVDNRDEYPIWPNLFIAIGITLVIWFFLLVIQESLKNVLGGSQGFSPK